MTSTRHILIIDDDQAYGQTLARGLRRQGYETSWVGRGAEGLAKARESKPDLVLLDIHLPDTDGVQVHKALREDARTHAMPIILITGVDILESLLEAAAAGIGAGPVFRKGHSFGGLLAQIEQLFADAGAGAASCPLDRVCRGPLQADLVRREVRIDGSPALKLPGKRFELFIALMAEESPASPERLWSAVWGAQGDLKVVSMTVSRLREDLQAHPSVEIVTTPEGYTLRCR